MSKKVDYDKFIKTINSKGFTTRITENEFINKYQGNLASNIKSGKKIPVVCVNGHQTYRWYQNINYGYGCIVCGRNSTKIKRSLTEENVKHILSLEGFKLLSPYTNSRDKITILCPNNHVFKKQWSNYQQGERCPLCNKGRSKPEKVIASFLSYNNINYIEQKYITNPYNTRTKLFFDFFIPSLKLIIEYDGEQHFVNNDKYSVYKSNKKYDNYKNYWCKTYNLNLKRIDGRYIKSVVDIYKTISNYMKDYFNLDTLTPDPTFYLNQNINDKNLCDFMDRYGIHKAELKFKLKDSALRDRYYFYRGKKYYSENYLNKIDKSSPENKQCLANFYINHSVKETAEKFSVSRSFVGVTFKEVFGMPKREYLSNT